MRYVRSRTGARQWLLHSPDLKGVLRARAEIGAAYARSIAPVGKTGNYKSGIIVEDGPIIPAWGDQAARQSMRITATAPYSRFVEFRDHVLAQTIPVIHDAKITEV